MHGAAIHILDLDALDLGQLLDAALYLIALRGLVAEALDEALGILDLLLLVLVGSALLFQALLTQLEVVAVVRAVVVQAAQLDL